MNIKFLSTVAVIAPDPPASRKLYVDALGLALESQGGEYHHSEQLPGCKSLRRGRRGGGSCGTGAR
jgi:catechol 2,3-dioxygenase-like lactoylglutathione lyase family enzyme